MCRLCLHLALTTPVHPTYSKHAMPYHPKQSHYQATLKGHTGWVLAVETFGDPAPVCPEQYSAM